MQKVAKRIGTQTKTPCKTVAPTIKTVAAAMAGNRKKCEKLPNPLKNKQNQCKTVAPAIERDDGGSGGW